MGTAAAKYGHEASLIKLGKPMQVGGVGQGTETCRYAIKTFLAIKHSDDNRGHLREWTAPIVDGNGVNLPGFLGMDSLEGNRAIADAGNGRLIYPGPGEVKIILPPGSIEMPIVKSQSGRPCILVDEYAKVVAKPPGGVKDPTHTPTVKKAKVVTPPTANEPLSSQLNKYEKPRGFYFLAVEDQPITSTPFAKEGDTLKTEATPR